MIIEHFPLRQSIILTTSFFLLATVPTGSGKKSWSKSCFDSDEQ
jgi:hypothetical protein